MTNQILTLREHLLEQRVTSVVMEATGDYWKPFYYLLEDAGIKLSAVAADITVVSSRAMLQALVDGQRDPAVLADLAQRRMRSKIPALVEALTGRFTDHHAFLTRMHLDLIDRHTSAIAEITERIEVGIEPLHGFRDLICTIPGISTLVADIITAETGADMSRFPTAGHLASWAGVCPGHHESAGRIKSTKTRPGNPYLKGALGTAALAASRSKDTGAHYDDPGPDYYARLRPDRTKRRAIHQLEVMGYKVTLDRAG
jgi:transposase